MAILQIVRVAAGVAPEGQVEKSAALQAIAHRVYAIAGLNAEVVLPTEAVYDEASGPGSLDALADQLRSPGTRDLAYTLAFLVSIADLELAAAETSTLEEFQRALGIDHRRATDLVILLAEIVAGGEHRELS